MTRSRGLLVSAILIATALGGWGAWFLWLRPNVSELMRRGVSASHKLNFHEAARFFDEVLRRDPLNHEALLRRGEIAEELKDFDLALSCWRKIPDDAVEFSVSARRFEGRLLLDRGNVRDAETALRRSLDLDPTQEKPHVTLLELYAQQMRTDDVRRQLLSLRDVRGWTVHELQYFSMSSSELETARSSATQLAHYVEVNPDDIPSRVALARCQRAFGQNDEVIATLRAGLQRFPGEPSLSGWLSAHFLNLSELASAAEVLEGAKFNGSLHAILWRSLGIYAADSANWEVATEYLEHSLAIDPNDPITNYRMGQALEEKGDQAAGVKYLERAQKIDQLLNRLELFSFKKQQSPQIAARVAVEIAQLLHDLQRPLESVLWARAALAYAPRDTAALTLEKKIVAEHQCREVSTMALGREIGVYLKTGRPLTAKGAPDFTRLTRPRQSSSIAGQKSSIRLRDCHQEAHVDFQYFPGNSGSKYMLETVGGGVAVLDFDGDNWPDLYFTQGTKLPFDQGDDSHLDRLYRNLGNGQFEDVTAAAGLRENRFSQGCVAGDIDNDGDPDLIVANFKGMTLFINNGDGTFSERTRRAGLKGGEWNSSLALADLDRDGFLDLYVVTYLLDTLTTCHENDGRLSTCGPLMFNGEQDILYRNRGDGTFEDISESAGIHAPEGKGLGVIIADLDADGWPDIYVSNDGTANFLFRNLRGEGVTGCRFSEEGLASGSALGFEGLAQASMGIAAGDFNGDGQTDLYVTNFFAEGSALYLNQGNLFFIDAIRNARLYTTTRSALGFGTQGADFDLDGEIDLFATNGHVDDYRYRNQPWKMPPHLFRNRGDAIFDDVSRDTGEFFQGEYLGRGAARVDWDRDGRPDIVVSHLDSPAALLRNETEVTGNWLSVDLRGVESNRDAIGATIRATVGSSTRSFEIYGGDGYYASNERRQIIGLGPATVVDVLEIVWPLGKVQRFSQIPSGRHILIVEGKQATGDE